MIDHPQQRKINPDLNERDYVKLIRKHMMSLGLEFNIYFERKDKESCEEIRQEYLSLRNELKMFLTARKKMEIYHNIIKE